MTKENSPNGKERILVQRISLYTHPELWKLAGAAADRKEITLNEWFVRLAALELKRPDLAAVPRKKMGRPRKTVKA